MTMLKKLALGLTLVLAISGVAHAGQSYLNCDNCKE